MFKISSIQKGQTRMLARIALAGALLVSISSVAQAAHRKHHPRTQTKHGKVSSHSKTPAGFLLIEEDAVLDMNELPRLSMADAQADFAEGNLSATYSDLRAASRAMKAEAKSTTSFAAKNYLINATNRLDHLAELVKVGLVPSNQALSTSLAEVLSIRADADREAAIAKFAVKSYKAAGFELRMAANDLEQAAQWSGRELDTTAHASAENIRRIGGQLIANRKIKASTARTAMNDFGASLERINAKYNDENGTSSATSIAP